MQTAPQGQGEECSITDQKLEFTVHQIYTLKTKNHRIRLHFLYRCNSCVLSLHRYNPHSEQIHYAESYIAHAQHLRWFRETNATLKAQLTGHPP